ncbi:MAG: preprotein translocase subunit YajC [Clostridia bacterium]|nr:preprotein translocase subunit YajC [Clostridia bacterium]
MFLSKIFTSLSILLSSDGNIANALEGTTADATAAAQPTANIWTTILSFVPFVLVIVAFYFFLIRPQRKQEKETQKMRNSIEIGDQITTIGGITGIVRQIKDDDTYIIETGADKNRISIKKWAIQSKDTISDS